MSNVIIVGAGIIGMLSAHLLSKKGVNVTLVEQGYAGKESSWAGGGILSPLYPWRYNDAVTRLAKWSQQNYPELLNRIKNTSGIDPQYYQSGLLYLNIESEQDQAMLWADNYQYQIDKLNKSSLNRIESGINSAFEQGWYSEEIAQVRNPRLVKSLQRLMEIDDNIALKTQTRVTQFIHQNRRVCGVETSRGKLTADQVIIAGGAWSAKLLDGYVSVPNIAPVKGQMIVFDAVPHLIRTIVLSQERYLIPRLDGKILLGSTLEFEGFDKSTSEQTLELLKQQAYNILPELENYPVEKHWAGLRPGAVDGVPFIGEHPEIKNLYLNAGHFRNGIVLGYASCELLANLVLGESPIVDPTPYQLHGNRLKENFNSIDLEEKIIDTAQ